MLIVKMIAWNIYFYKKCLSSSIMEPGPEFSPAQQHNCKRQESKINQA